MKTFISWAIFICFTFTGIVGPYQAYAQEEFRLPLPGVMVPLSPEFNPPILKGIKVHLDNPFRFDFILDKGDSELNNDQVKDESIKLIKYFLASLTIPEKDLWVNLSPYEKDRIIPNSFGLTEMGRDLLAEDYMLKQITASLIYPEDEIGKRFWKKIYEEAVRKYGTSNIPVNTFNKVWIVPEKAVVYENANAGTAYVVESKLKVMLEQDYLSLKKHEEIQSKRILAQGTNELGSQIVREIVIPELYKEVNEGKNFSQLRQVYNSLILAAWYKKKIRDSILAQVYENKNKVMGIKIGNPQEKEKIYQQYLKAFKKGVYNYIKEDIDPNSSQMIPRKYFSGGVDAALITPTLDIRHNLGEVIIVADHAMRIDMRLDMAPQDMAMSSTRGFRQSPYGPLSAQDYEQRVEVMVARGLTYEEAALWWEAKMKSNVRFPPGFWERESTVKNFIYVALDSTIPGFKKAREENDIKTMAELYRKHVFTYKAKNSKRFQDGQFGFYYEAAGLRNLMREPRGFLDKDNSPAALLRFALPGLIDLKNPDALDPLEVEHNYWTDPKNAEHHIFLALDTIPGFKEARDKNDIKTMAILYRKHVIEYKAVDTNKFHNGQLGFFEEMGGLKGLMSYSRGFLKKTNSPAAILRFVLPNLIDVRNPDALDPLEVEQNYWTDPDNARYHIFLILDSIPGFADARKENNIKVMAELYRRFVIGYRAKDNEKYSNSQNGFFEEAGGLRSLMGNPSKFLSKTRSPAALLRFSLPGLIDLKNPDALKPLEVERDYWTDPENAEYHILSSLDTVPGFKEAREKSDIKTMAELYRTHVIKYVVKNTSEYVNGQQGFFYEVGGLRSLMQNDYGNFFDKRGSAAAVLRFALPALVNQSNPDALRTEEIERDNAQLSVDQKKTLNIENQRIKTEVSRNGGIDLTPANMNLQTQNSGGEIKFYLNPAMLQKLQNAPGFVPVIINIQPMTDLHMFLGLKKDSSYSIS